mmetsp:Transcript_25810/g.87027  ORF Transcript_25810/g.87027 Transcript_25810/m.87027 type:complete len:218 (-) Transcript_25810:626-1279(-)
MARSARVAPRLLQSSSSSIASPRGHLLVASFARKSGFEALRDSPPDARAAARVGSAAFAAPSADESVLDESTRLARLPPPPLVLFLEMPPLAPPLPRPRPRPLAARPPPRPAASPYQRDALRRAGLTSTAVARRKRSCSPLPLHARSSGVVRHVRASTASAAAVPSGLSEKSNEVVACRADAAASAEPNTTTADESSTHSAQVGGGYMSAAPGGAAK